MDVAVLANCDADAILAVYPWTPNTRILQAVATVANVPILAGIGGGLTKGLRAATIGAFAEESGAQAVVLNAPTPIETLINVNRVVDVPTLYTIVRHITPELMPVSRPLTLLVAKKPPILWPKFVRPLTASTRISRLLLLAVKPMSRSLPRSKLALMR